MPPVRRLPRWAATVVALLVTAVVTAPLALGAQQAEDPEVRVHRQSGGPGEETTLVVTTPPAVIGAALPPTAFTVLQDGVPVPAEVAPYRSQNLEIALVLGARSTASLDAEQEAGAEFLRFLGGSSRIAVIDASGPRTLVPMTTEGDPVGQALLDVENAASSEPTSEAAVETALGEFTDEASRRAVVLMTDDDGAVSPALAGRLVEAGASLLYVQAAVDAEPVPSLVDAADASGGRALEGDLRGLIRTVDRVRADLDNQYRVRFAASDAATTEVRVVTAGGVLTGSVDLAAPPATVPPRAEEPGGPPATEAQASAADDGGGGGGSGAAIAVIGLLVVLAGAAVAALLLVRRRRSAPPPAPGPVVLDLRTGPADGPVEPAGGDSSLAGPRGEHGN